MAPRRRRRWPTLHDEGKVAAFPAIGYEHPDQSHFTSRHYYEIGELDIGQHAGWLGRYLDVVGDEENPLQGLSMDGSLSPMLATAQKPVAAIGSVDSYEMWSPVGDPIDAEMYKTLRQLRLAAVATRRRCCRSAAPPRRPRRCARN